MDSAPPTVRETGLDSGEVPKSIQNPRRGACKTPPGSPDPWGEVPARREPGWNQTLLRARGLGAGSVITNHSNSFLGPFQKALFFPALCCWIAEDDLEPEPSISLNGTVSQIARPKGPLDSSAQPPAQARPAQCCLIRALMLQLLPSAPRHCNSHCQPCPGLGRNELTLGKKQLPCSRLDSRAASGPWAHPCHPPCAPPAPG